MNPLLGRWISADPLAVHAPGEADLNVYAYVSGHVLQSVDPLGLYENAAEAMYQSRKNNGYGAAILKHQQQAAAAREAVLIKRASQLAAVHPPRVSEAHQDRGFQTVTDARMGNNAGATQSPMLFTRATRARDGTTTISVQVRPQPSVIHYNAATRRIAGTSPDQYVPSRTLQQHEGDHATIQQRLNDPAVVSRALREAQIEGTVQTASMAEAAAYREAVGEYLQSYNQYMNDRALHQEAVKAGDPTYTSPTLPNGADNPSYVPHSIDIAGNVELEPPKFHNPLNGETTGPTSDELDASYRALSQGVPNATSAINHPSE